MTDVGISIKGKLKYIPIFPLLFFALQPKHIYFVVMGNGQLIASLQNLISRIPILLNRSTDFVYLQNIWVFSYNELMIRLIKTLIRCVSCDWE